MPMTGTGDPPPAEAAAQAFRRVERVLGARYQLERMVAASAERVLFVAADRVLLRRVSLRVNFFTDQRIRDWFLREAEALARLDHPALRHVYDVGVEGDLAYRVGNWVDGESLTDAVGRGPVPIPDVLALARGLLGGLEHAHVRGVVLRRLVPSSVIITPGGRGTITDVRFCNRVLRAIPDDTRVTGLPFMAPETRSGAEGDALSDVYAAGALLYITVTGHEPPLDPAQLQPPCELRPACPQALERVLLRALQPRPEARYLSAGEMLESVVSEAGGYFPAAISAGRMDEAEDGDLSLSEQRLRRALGDDYELLDQLGAGGFGRVYRVRDLHLEREVALKVLHPTLTRDPEVVARFRREAQLAARLNHPNIVNIYDIAGRSGLMWYTMAMVRGPSLAQWVDREGPMPINHVLRILREALAALTQAHVLGLVHRDLKPENMLLDPDGSLRITDFGLALALRGGGRFGGATSQSGTPQFASPEQLLGERVDQRTDLYSLSAVACFLLAGRTPFPGSTPEQILARQTTNQLPQLRVSRPDLDVEVERVVLRALRADPAERFSSAPEFLAALDRATGKGTRRRGGEWSSRLAPWRGPSGAS